MKAQFFVAIISALLVILGGWAALAEIDPYFEVRNSPAQRFATARNDVPAYGLSHKSQFLALNDCSQNISSYYGRAQPTTQRNVVLEHCGQLIKEIIAVSPANGFAWYLLAEIAAESGDTDLLNLALVQSQNLTRNEQWIAEMRIYAFEDNFKDLSPKAIAAEQDDLSLLVKSRRGVTSIASRYVSNPTFRARITHLVEKLPPEIQARFVRYVRTAANRN